MRVALIGDQFYLTSVIVNGVKTLEKTTVDQGKRHRVTKISAKRNSFDGIISDWVFRVITAIFLFGIVNFGYLTFDYESFSWRYIFILNLLCLVGFIAILVAQRGIRDIIERKTQLRTRKTFWRVIATVFYFGAMLYAFWYSGLPLSFSSLILSVILTLAYIGVARR